jgi:dUTP pyrophosphatase
MNRVSVKIMSVHREKPCTPPQYATIGSAGVDLLASLDGELLIQPGEIVRVPTGIAIGLPGPEIGAFIFARSGLATKHGLALANGVGVIDSDYRGEIQVAVINQGAQAFKVSNGDRIAQMVFLPVYLADFQIVNHLDDTTRGSGGFGSTGI